MVRVRSEPWLGATCVLSQKPNDHALDAGIIGAETNRTVSGIFRHQAHVLRMASKPLQRRLPFECRHDDVPVVCGGLMPHDDAVAFQDACILHAVTAHTEREVRVSIDPLRRHRNPRFDELFRADGNPGHDGSEQRYTRSQRRPTLKADSAMASTTRKLDVPLPFERAKVVSHRAR